MTLVIYMGVSQAARIADGLMARLPAGLPAAVVQHASRPNERRVLTTLGGLVATLAEQGFGSPAILIVGRVLEGASSAQVADMARRAGNG